MISNGYFFYIETSLCLENNNSNIAKVLKEGFKNDLMYIDSESFLNIDKKQYLSIEQAIEILNRDLSETSFVTILLKNTTISIWINKKNENLSFTFSFLSENLLEKNYLPDNAIDTDIHTYSNIVIEWLKPFGIEQFHIEYCKP